jgi:tetratricopeptide (TPR) repeat protein
MTGPFEPDDGLSEVAWTASRMLEGGHHLGVLVLCTSALRDFGDGPQLRVLRARALMALRRLDEAERDLALGLRLRPQSATIHRLLCEVALSRGDLPRAELLLERALDLDPTHPRGRELAEVCLGWRVERTARLYGLPRAA